MIESSGIANPGCYTRPGAVCRASAPKACIARRVRLRWLLLAAWLAALPAAAVERLAAGRLDLPPPARPQAAFELHLVLLEGSGWLEREIEPLARAAAEVFGACGIWLRRLHWQRLRVGEALMDFSTAAASRLLASHPVPRPAAFLVRDTRQREAFDAEAIGRGNSRTRPALRDTVWLTRALPHPRIGLSHELAHVLMNSGRHDQRPGNLMRERSAPGNTRLAPDQCRELLENGVGNGLLRPLQPGADADAGAG